MNSGKCFLYLALFAGSLCNAQIAKRNASHLQPTNFEMGRSSACCDIADEEESFLECLKSAAAETRDAALTTAVGAAGPKLTVAIVTPIQKNSFAAAFSFGIKEAYAEANGYFVDVFNYKGTASTDWEKIEYLAAALDDLNGWARHVDYLLWVDNDLVIVDIGMRVEAIFSSYKKASMILSEGMHNKKIATDFVMLRNNPRTVELLEDWLRVGRGVEMSFVDSESFYKLTEGESEEYEVLVKVLPPDALNTFFPAAKNFKPHNQVLNLAEEHEMYKKRAFAEAFHGMCRVDASIKGGESPTQVLPQQLDMNAKNLTKWGISVYRALFEEQLEEYSQGSMSGGNDGAVSGALSDSLRKLTRLMEENDQPVSAQGLREKAFKHMFLNFKKRRPLNVEHKQKTGEYFPDWLDFMDHITLVGSEYAQKITDEEDRRVAMKVMLELANELESMDATRVSVQQRLMNIHMDLGMVHGTSDEDDASIKHFVEAVRIGRVLLSNKIITDGDMFFPLSFCGDAFMKQSRYKEALVMYGYAIDIGKKSLASRDIMFQTLKLQYGIACYYDKRYRTAVRYIEEALNFFARNEIEMDEGTYAIVNQAVKIAEAARKAKYDPKVLNDDLKSEF